MFEKLEKGLQKIVNPMAQKLSDNQSLKAVSAGFVKLMPITLGLVVFSIIGNLPITGFTDWLTDVGLMDSINAALTASTSIISIYVVFAIAYNFANNRNQSGITAGFISLAGFVLLIPQTVQAGKETVSALPISYMGSSGIVLALIISICVGHLYCYLCEKNVTFKMPSSVPPMVSESLEPIFVAMIIFGLLFIVRVGFSFTEFKNAADFVSKIVSKPLLAIGTSIPSLIFVLFVSNVFWWFGIHPQTIQGPVSSVLYMMMLDNIDKFGNGKEMLYVLPLLVYLIAGIGGNGNTLGLLISMISAKSKRYKQMFKLALVPHIFNINEPLIFGMPIILNPFFFIPMTVNCVISGIIAWIYLSVVPFTYNPMMELLPWTTPVFVKYFLSGGIALLVLVLILVAVNTIIYYPFFKMADNEALKEEMAGE